MMRLGETVRVPVEMGEAHPAWVVGTVVWIHPQGRFYTVEFRRPGGTYRQSYRGDEA